MFLSGSTITNRLPEQLIKISVIRFVTFAAEHQIAII